MLGKLYFIALFKTRGIGGDFQELVAGPYYSSEEAFGFLTRNPELQRVTEGYQYVVVSGDLALQIEGA